MNKEIQVELVIDAKATLGEGPHWNGGTGELYWVDIEGMALHIYEKATGKLETHRFEQKVSAVIPSKEGRLVLTMQDGIYTYNPASRTLEVMASIESDMPGNRFNDAKCDPRGRLWAGTLDMSFTSYSGSLYVLEAGKEPRRVLTEVGCSNGLAWDERKSAMYFIDTMKKEVYRFSWDAVSGMIRGRELVMEWPTGVGAPDGMTIDSEGMLWIAHWGGGRVSRWNPDTAQLLSEIHVPALNVTSCVFGGEALDELYITTARTGTSPSDLAKYPHAGGVFMTKPGVKGTESQSFG